MFLATLLENAAHRYPDAEAVIENGRRLTYAQWNERVNRVAHALTQLGLRQGDCVALCSANSEAMATMLLAVIKNGGVAVPLNTRWKAAELAYAFADANVRAVFFDQHTAAVVNEALGEHSRPVLRICADDVDAFIRGDLRGYPHARLTATVESNGRSRRFDISDTAMILYTSGTLGKPKGVPRSHLNDFSGILAMIVAHGWTMFERTLAVMPFYHVMGLHTLLAMVALNGTCVIESKFDPASVAKAIHEEQLTALYLVPTAYHDLVAYIETNGGPKGSVPKLAYAGAPMPERLITTCQAVFRPQVFVNHYGCTEAQIISANPAAHKKPGSAGRPALNTRIRVVTADPNRSVSPDEMVPAGVPGEVIVDASSPQVFAGYLHRMDATQRALRDGWYFTGDLGVFDADGDLHIVGRVDDMIVSGGENIHPTEVEAVLSRHPDVCDIAVVGLPDKRWGQMVTAFIVPAHPYLSPKTLDEFCLSHSELARFKRPRRYIFVSSIPRSSTGKVLRSLLRSGQYAIRLAQQE